MDSPQFLLDWGRVQRLLEERYGSDVEVPVEPTPLASQPSLPSLPLLPPPSMPPPSLPRVSLPRPTLPPPRLPAFRRPPDSIAPAVMTARAPVTPEPRKLGWIVGVAVALSGVILAVAVMRVALRSTPAAAASPADARIAAATVAAPPAPPTPPEAAPTPTDPPVVSVDKLPHAKGAKSGKPARAKKHR